MGQAIAAWASDEERARIKCGQLGTDFWCSNSQFLTVLVMNLDGTVVAGGLLPFSNSGMVGPPRHVDNASTHGETAG